MYTIHCRTQMIYICGGITSKSKAVISAGKQLHCYVNTWYALRNDMFYVPFQRLPSQFMQLADSDRFTWPGHATPWITSVTGCSFPRPWSEPANIPQEWTPGKDSIFYQRNHTHHTFDDYYEGTYVHPGFGIIKITTKLGVLQFEYKEVYDRTRCCMWTNLLYYVQMQ